MSTSRQLAAIMFTDMVGYTTLMGKNSAKALELVRISKEIQQPLVEEYNGKWLKEMGDGFMTRFDTASEAINCAHEIQKRAWPVEDLKLRIGIHLGEVSVEGDDIFGDAVNIASRLEAITDPGGIYISETVHKSIRGMDVASMYVGELQLKNVDYPVKTYAIQGEALPVPDGSKRKQLNVPRVSGKIPVWVQAAIYLVLTVSIISIIYWPNSHLVLNGEEKALAVLPIKNNSGDSLENYFAFGITEELISEFSRIQALRVITSQSTKQYASTLLPMPQIARELGVDFLIDASVNKDENKIEVRIRLVGFDPAEDVIWAETYTSDLRNIYTLYNEMIKEVVEVVEVPLRQSEEINLAKASLVNPGAYEAYLKGNYHWDRLSAKDLDLAEMYYQKAIDLDAEFAPAYFGLSSVWGGRAQQGLIPGDEAQKMVQSYLIRALQFNNELYAIHTRMAGRSTWGEWDWEAGGRSYRKALELNPNDAKAHAYYAHYLNIIRDTDDVLFHAERSVKLDPNNSLIHGLYGMSLNSLKMYDEAIKVLTKSLATSSDRILLSTLQTSYHLNGMHDEALDLWIRLYDQHFDDSVAVETLRKGSEQGYSQALEALAQLFEERYVSGSFGYIRPWSIATMYARSGNEEKALDYLELAFGEHDQNMPYISCDPIFDDLRNNPRFRTLIGKMHYPGG